MTEARSDDEVILGELPTEEELFYVSWGDQLFKDSLAALNQSIRQMVTISAALLGGAVAFYDKQIVHQPIMIVVMTFLLVALGVSFYGILPISNVVPRRSPTDISRAVLSGMDLKRNIVWGSAIPLFLALTLLCAGVIVKQA